MTFQLPAWLLIPSIFLLTSFYLGLGSAGHWNYSQNDFIYGNMLVSAGVGLCYLTKFTKEKWYQYRKLNNH